MSKLKKTLGDILRILAKEIRTAEAAKKQIKEREGRALIKAERQILKIYRRNR